MPECRAVLHLISPLPEWTKTPMPELMRYRDKRTQSGTGMLRYRTEIQDAGMPMPAASASVPMPNVEKDSRVIWISGYFYRFSNRNVQAHPLHSLKITSKALKGLSRPLAPPLSRLVLDIPISLIYLFCPESLKYWKAWEDKCSIQQSMQGEHLLRTSKKIQNLNSSI